MRLLSWNINGIRTLPQYHPWNTLKTCEAILDELKADIICFQEMKSSRASLEKHAAVPPSYNSFFSFPATKGGYSGVAVYTKSQSALPLKAEEGLSGSLQPKPPLTQEERVSLSYPSADDMELVPDENGRTPTSMHELDLEGRALVVDFGLFVLINLYCPNETSDERLPYKLNFHLMLEDRVRKLIHEGREVIVTGDINICSAPIDHCDGALASRANEFWEHPARAWFKKWLHPNGPLVDVIRDCWQGRQGMYTCWNTKISARESNYGTRIDYFLLTRGLLKWFKHGDIQPSVKGSDHCPIYIDLHDEIVTGSGETVTLRQAMKMDGPLREAPRIAAQFWKEYSGKQKLLSSFFGKKSNDLLPMVQASAISEPIVVEQQSTLPPTPPLHVSSTPLPIASSSANSTKTLPSSLDAQVTSSQLLESTTTSSLPKKTSKTSLSTTSATTETSSGNSSKRRKPQADSNYPAQPMKKQKKKEQSGQAKLSSFFTKPAASKSPPVDDTRTPDVVVLDDDAEELDAGVASFARTPSQSSDNFMFDPSSYEAFSSSPGTSEESKTAWSQLFAPIEAPKCTIHGEPAKQYTVNKPGPNKGKTFYLCSRPVGPGYDSGKSRRLREEVDHRYRCNFFKWTSDVKKASAHP